MKPRSTRGAPLPIDEGRHAADGGEVVRDHLVVSDLDAQLVFHERHDLENGGGVQNSLLQQGELAVHLGGRPAKAEARGYELTDAGLGFLCGHLSWPSLRMLRNTIGQLRLSRRGRAVRRKKCSSTRPRLPVRWGFVESCA